MAEKSTADTIAAIYAQQMAAAEKVSETPGQEGVVSPPSAGAGPAATAAAASEPSSSSESASATPTAFKVGDVDLTPYNLPEDVRKRIETGYLRQSDYTKKTQTLAEERRLLEAERNLADQARQWSALLEQHPELQALIVDHVRGRKATGSPTNGTARVEPTVELPENFDELTASEQAKHIARLAGREAAAIVRPEIEQVRLKIAESEREKAEEAELSRAYPEVDSLPEDDPVIQECDRVLDAAPHLTLRQAFEIVMAPRWKAQAQDAARTKIASHRAAASTEKPGMGSEAESMIDVRKAKSAEEAMRWAAEATFRRLGIT